MGTVSHRTETSGVKAPVNWRLVGVRGREAQLRHASLVSGTCEEPPRTVSRRHLQGSNVDDQ